MTAASRMPSLKRCWSRSAIVQVGTHAEANLPVYLVEFGERLVVGCLEEEIIPL